MENLSDILSCISQFKNEIDVTNPNKTVVRANLLTEDDANHWIKRFGEISKTNWIVKKCRRKETKTYVKHKSWLCQHSARNKTAGSSRKTDCSASIDIYIKKFTAYTRRVDPFVKQSSPLCAVITINMRHNHSLGSIGALKFLRVNKDIVARFQGYFSDGLAPAEAIRAHENLLMMQPDSTEALANGSLNPTQRTVYHLHDKWKINNFGSSTAPLDKLKEKIETYAKQGVSVFVKETSPYAVLVVTDVMKRAQMLPSSKEMIFIDSSSSCDSTQATVTTLLTVTKAGAVPIGVIIHESQSTAGYTDAFSMLAEHFPMCFGGEKAPNIVMTDDSAAEKAALKSVWPDAHQLLCHFHMAQAEWRWLISSTSKVPQEERKALMKLFQKAMYADSEEILASAIEDIVNLDGHEKFVDRFQKNLKRKEQWVLCFRTPLTTRNNHTNNYAEACIRVLKDIVLQRTKAFNVVALVEFCGSIWNQYFVGRLLNFAHGRRAAPLLGFEALCRKMKDADLEKIRQISDSTYGVPSATQVDVEYTIDIAVGVCTCPVGSSGSFCKHQAALHKKHGVMLPNLPPINAKERFALAQLALGEKCPHPDFFKDLMDSVLDLGHEPSTSAVIDSTANSPATFSSIAPLEECMQSDESDLEASLLELKSELRRIEHLMTTCSAPHIRKLTRALTKITTESNLIASIVKLSESVASSQRRGRKIRVQPTAISRRRDGVTRGSRRIAAGRPATRAVAVAANIKKRSHKLSLSINANVAHAKGHGAGH